MSNTGSLRAWVDESGSDHVQDPGTYVLAAAIGRRGPRGSHSRTGLPAAATRSEQVALARRGRTPARHHRERRRRLRYRLRGRRTHRRNQDRAERRRRKCLERLLLELERRVVTDVVLEFRGPADDRRDIHMLNALRGRRYVSTSIRLSHVIGRLEPMLWIPDAVCGAVTSSRTGNPAPGSPPTAPDDGRDLTPTSREPRALSSGRKSRGSLPRPSQGGLSPPLYRTCRR